MGEIKSDRIARFLERTAPENEADLLDEMCQRMTGAVDGEMCGLPAICAAWDVPYGRVLSWLMADEKRYGIYQRALEMQAHALVSEAISIVDESPGVSDKGTTDAGDVAWKKLRVDTRLRLAEKHAPRMYGKSEGGGGGITVVVNRQIGNPSVEVAPPLCDAVTIECDGRNLTIN